MSIAAFLYILALAFSSATLGIYANRRLNRREMKALPAPQTDRLLSGISPDDQQWLQVFRETVMAADGQISPFLEQWLTMERINRLEYYMNNVLNKAREQANEERDRILNAANSEAVAIRRLAVEKKLDNKMCAYCNIRSDPRCKGGNCGQHCIRYCPNNCRY